MSKDFLAQLQQHSWKGNIRELKNIIERAVILSDGTELSTVNLPLRIPAIHYFFRKRVIRFQPFHWPAWRSCISNACSTIPKATKRKLLNCSISVSPLCTGRSRSIIFPELFHSQAFYRVGQRCSDRLHTNGEDRNEKGQCACYRINRPADMDPVCKALQPFVHSVPGERYGNHYCNGYELQQIAGE